MGKASRCIVNRGVRFESSRNENHMCMTKAIACNPIGDSDSARTNHWSACPAGRVGHQCEIGPVQYRVSERTPPLALH